MGHSLQSFGLGNPWSPILQDGALTSRKKRRRGQQGGGAPKRRRRRGGGAYRTYVHLQSVGNKLSGADMRSLGAQYRALDAEEKARLSALGSEATALHAEGLPSFPMHSLRSQHANDIPKQQRRRQAVSPGLCADDRNQLRNSIVDGRSVGLPPVPGDTNFREHFKRLIAAVAHDIGEPAREIEQQRERNLETLMSSRSEEVILQTRRRLQALESAKWVGIPHSCPAMACVFRSQAVAPASWTQPGARFSSTGLSEDWKKHHRGLDHSQARFVDPGLRRQQCFTQHFCHCKGRGLRIKPLCIRARQQIIDWCRDESIASVFSEGEAVLQWTSQTITREETQDLGDGNVEREVEATHTFTHISLLYLRPWRITLTVLTPVDEETKNLIAQTTCHANAFPEAAELARPLRFRVATKEDGTVNMLTFWHFLDTFLDSGSEVSMRLHQLSTRATPAPAFTSLCLWRMEVRSHTVWRGAEAERRVAPRVNARQLLEDSST